eukprot:CAMPEP_0114674558 /NCGR_PEP_ID=MMETSP0191-20121206/46525_1 /TAXON_ID=126664 /ORGANISM="Sorites sp." /LENGTH=51 /DNA_ID=CAMNT_0001942015 /DNA_START=119 /DNA_END=271 /DNA_ORIENTATION=-
MEEYSDIAPGFTVNNAFIAAAIGMGIGTGTSVIMNGIYAIFEPKTIKNESN